MADLNLKGWFVVALSTCCLTAVFAASILTSNPFMQFLLSGSVILGAVAVGGIVKEYSGTFMRETLYEGPIIIDVTGKDRVKCPKCGLPIKVPARTISLRHLEVVQEQKQLAQNELVNMGLFPLIVNPRYSTQCPVCNQSIICIDQFSLHIKSRKLSARENDYP